MVVEYMVQGDQTNSFSHKNTEKMLKREKIEILFVFSSHFSIPWQSSLAPLREVGTNPRDLFYQTILYEAVAFSAVNTFNSTD